MRDKLIELIKEAKKHTKGANCDIERNMIFADYLLENGVILLHCNVGSIVYETDGVIIYESHINEIYIDDHSKIIYYTDGIAFDETAIGRSIFLTKEEAEQKLKGGEG